jgi:hypothetical protein
LGRPVREVIARAEAAYAGRDESDRLSAR